MNKNQKEAKKAARYLQKVLDMELPGLGHAFWVDLQTAKENLDDYIEELMASE
jgi:hypothetical protein